MLFAKTCDKIRTWGHTDVRFDKIASVSVWQKHESKHATYFSICKLKPNVILNVSPPYIPLTFLPAQACQIQQDYLNRNRYDTPAFTYPCSLMCFCSLDRARSLGFQAIIRKSHTYEIYYQKMTD